MTKEFRFDTETTDTSDYNDEFALTLRIFTLSFYIKYCHNMLHQSGIDFCNSTYFSHYMN